MNPSTLLNKLATGALILGTGVSLVQTSLYTVNGGHRAVMFDRFQGIKPDTIGEGTHFRIPWVQRPIVYDIRIRPRSIATATGTKDLQTATLTLRVLSRPDVKYLPWIYSNYGVDYDERVLPSIGNEVLKAVVAQYNADQLLIQREQVSHQIRDALTKRAKDFHITLDDVAITELKFSKDFTEAVEAKQVAYQEAERAKFVVQKSEQQKRAAIIRAEGESESAKLVQEAMKNGDGFLELRKIEAAREIVGTLARSRNVTYLPSQANMLLSMGEKGA